MKVSGDLGASRPKDMGGMNKNRKKAISVGGNHAALFETMQSPQEQLYQLEETIRVEQRKVESEIAGMCADLRQLLAASTLSPSELSRWQKVQKDLKRLLRNPTYSSHYEFRLVAKEFIAIDLTTFPLPGRSATCPPVTKE